MKHNDDKKSPSSYYKLHTEAVDDLVSASKENTPKYSKEELEKYKSSRGKWKLPVICSLIAGGPSRYNDLLRSTRGVSNTMLSKTLKELEADGLVERREYLEVPVRVEYEATERAMSLAPILAQLIAWQRAGEAG